MCLGHLSLAHKFVLVFLNFSAGLIGSDKCSQISCPVVVVGLALVGDLDYLQKVS
jgi:hypothetical protein